MMAAHALLAPCATHCTRRALSISGGWTSHAQLEYEDRQRGRAGEPLITRTYYTWKATVEGPESFVTLLYGELSGKLRWAKVEKRVARPLSLAVTFMPWGPRWPGQFWVTLGAEGNGSLGIHKVTLVGNPDPSRVPVADGPAATGLPVELLRVEGSPVRALGALFLAKSDVRFGRKGLWSIHPRIAGVIGEPLATVLRRGRSGWI